MKHTKVTFSHWTVSFTEKRSESEVSCSTEYNSVTLTKAQTRTAFGSRSLVCKFIRYVFDLLYELATRESDQYFLNVNLLHGQYM